jgi:hypothetical protein
MQPVNYPVLFKHLPHMERSFLPPQKMAHSAQRNFTQRNLVGQALP